MSALLGQREVDSPRFRFQMTCCGNQWLIHFSQSSTLLFYPGHRTWQNISHRPIDKLRVPCPSILTSADWPQR